MEKYSYYSDKLMIFYWTVRANNSLKICLMALERKFNFPWKSNKKLSLLNSLVMLRIKTKWILLKCAILWKCHKYYITRLLKSHSWDMALTSIPDKAIATAAPAMSSSMQEINCMQIENCVTLIQPEISPNIANPHDPLVSDMPNISKFLHNSKINIKLPGEKRFFSL